MKSLGVAICLWLACHVVQAQSITVTATLEKDTFGYEEAIKVVFTIENVQNFDFVAPPFTDFVSARQLGTSSNMRIINGQMTQSVSYTYLLEHPGMGLYIIEPASITVDGKVYQSELQEVVVTNEPMTRSQQQADPYGMPRIQEYSQRFDFPLPDGWGNGGMDDMGLDLRRMQEQLQRMMPSMGDLDSLFRDMPQLRSFEFQWPKDGQPLPKPLKPKQTEKKVYKL